MVWSDGSSLCPWRNAWFFPETGYRFESLMKKGFLLYAGLVVIFGLGMFFTLERGRHLQPPAASTQMPRSVKSLQSPPARTENAPSIWSSLEANLHEPLSRL